MLFDIFRKKEDQPKNVPWRDSTGTIACQGICPDECDKGCPIWLNNIGLAVLKLREYDKAIQTFSEALAIAPDFYDAQNNLGTAYGMKGQHPEAYQAFKKAHDMKRDRPKALHGLIVAETNLGMFEEAMCHCFEYDQLPGCNSENLRKALLAKK